MWGPRPPASASEGEAAFSGGPGVFSDGVADPTAGHVGQRLLPGVRVAIRDNSQPGAGRVAKAASVPLGPTGNTAVPPSPTAQLSPGVLGRQRSAPAFESPSRVPG